MTEQTPRAGASAAPAKPAAIADLKPGDRLEMLVPCVGDVDDVETTAPIGASAVVDRVDYYGPAQGWAVTVVIQGGPGDGVVNVFDEADGDFAQFFRPRAWAPGDDMVVKIDEAAAFQDDLAIAFHQQAARFKAAGLGRPTGKAQAELVLGKLVDLQVKRGRK